MWKVGLTLYVVIKKTSRKGKLVAKKGTKWDFRPNGWKRTVSICPVRFRWHYDFSEKVVAWPEKLGVVLIKSTLQPFRLKREYVGKWRGAATARTTACKLPVWQVYGTNTLYVGHLGMWKLVVANGRELKALENIPTKENFFVGRGPLSAKKFKCLKTICRRPRRVPCLQKTMPIFNIPTRDELSTFKIKKEGWR